MGGFWGGPSEARKAIEAAYRKADAAAGKLDADGAFAAFLEDGVFIDTAGHKFSRAATLQHVKEHFAAAKSVHQVTQLTRFELNGSSAKVGVKEHLEVKMLNPETGKMTMMIINDTASDEWIRRGEVWRQKSSRNLAESVSVMIDGNPAK